jgi:hypothetical protein
MLKIRSIYYRLPIRRTMDEELETIAGNSYNITSALIRIADALEKLLKYTEMKL